MGPRTGRDVRVRILAIDTDINDELVNAGINALWDCRADLIGLFLDLSIDWKGRFAGHSQRVLGEAVSLRKMRLRIEVTDGTKEWLTEAEVDAVCDALWSSKEKGALSIVGKVADERRRSRVLQEGIRLTESEFHMFRRALDDARR